MNIKNISIYITFALLVILFNTEIRSNNLPKEDIHLTVKVTDTKSKIPLKQVRLTLRMNGELIENKVTDYNGMAVFEELSSGKYEISANNTGYTFYSDTITLDRESVTINIFLNEEDISTNTIIVNANSESAVTSIDKNTGNQVFQSEYYRPPPNSRITNLIQENLTGTSRAPTGEVHIRGQHGEFTYYVDGLPVPLGVFGGLNEVIDPKVIDRINFYTGGFPAEYGGQIAAVMDIQNRVPSGRFHLDLSSYAGSFLVFNGTKPFSPGAEVPAGLSSNVPGDTLGGRVGPLRAINSNGQDISFSNHLGKFAYYLSGSRQETDSRIDLPVSTLYNDRGTDYFVYGKFDYLLSKSDYLTTNLNYGNTNTQVPFDINEQGFSPDNQKTSNSFQTLSYYRDISAKKDLESKLFAGIWGRQGSLLYTPGLESPANFQFTGDSNYYALTSDRNFSSIGTRIKYEKRFSQKFKMDFGLSFSATEGKENFTSRDSLGNPGPSVLTNYKGSDFGIFAQGQFNAFKKIRLDIGLRYDQQISPNASLQNQVSPRIRANFFFDNSNTAYLYYGKLFMPNNLEGLQAISANVDTAGSPTLPEKDDLFEAVYLHLFKFGLTSKLSFFYKFASPGVDDETVGSSAIKTPVNIDKVKTTGIELSLSYANRDYPLSGYINASLIHAYGSGQITGGFLPIDDAGTATDLDHDQRLSIVCGLNYHPGKWFVNLVSIFGSGLTNGNPNGVMFNTGLFDFNADAHVPYSATFDLSAGYSFNLFKNASLTPSVYITNLFDNAYLLKGAYFSSASYGSRRNVMLKLALHI